MRKRKHYAPSFKAKVAVAALKGKPLPGAPAPHHQVEAPGA
jgi:hypothetical protein